ARVEQTPPDVSAFLGALGTQARDHVRTVRRAVHALHRRDHAKLAEARNVGSVDVLGMLDPPAQILAAAGRLPDFLFACVGGGSNSIGLFYEFLGDPGVKMVGVEAGGRGTTLGEHAARLAAAAGFSGARPGVLQGTYTYVLQNADGQIATTHSVSAGLDYPAIGPEHAWLADQGRAEYTAVSDDAAVDAARLLARVEGIIPALETAHALAGLVERAPKMTREQVVILNISGRGDKDMDILSRYL
ncbi:MAG: pyridoxal-phosphate dependent enzyme, partial [Acidobacteria bacterium]|nr:pyridoxal-phosphate dependent enzyme [Acidobacteriota bacterium]